MNLEVEIVVLSCPKCQRPVETRWMRDNTGLLPGDFVLAGDSVFHLQCWDQIVLENPIRDDVEDSGSELW
jgi:hypothetical protein